MWPKSMASFDLMHQHVLFLRTLSELENKRKGEAPKQRGGGLKASHFASHDSTATKRFPVSKPLQHDRNVPQPSAAPIVHPSSSAPAPMPMRSRKGRTKVKIDQADPRSIAAATARHQASA